MQLAEKNGISCDHCGITHRHDFTYYSFDFRPVVIVDNRRPSLDFIFNINVVFSLDICSTCYEKMATNIVHNYNKIMSPQRKIRIDTICEFSGKIMVGNYTYYHVNVVKVVVRMTNQPFICVKCKMKTFDSQKPCVGCNNVGFVCLASVSSTDRFIEINLCEDVYKKLTNNAGVIRAVAGQWSTKSL